MNAEVSWLLEGAVKPGRLDSFRTVIAEMVESTRAESGALSYEWSISDDDSVVHIHEGYADSAATLTHLATFREQFAERFLAAVQPTRFVVYGTPSDEVKEALEASGPVYMRPFVGFAR
jgi:quinol monooxygenase YgiN